MPIRIVTGSQIRAGRALAGLRRCDLAHAAGLHPNAVSYWERHERIPGRREPHAVERMRIALEGRGVAAFVDPSPGVRIDRSRGATGGNGEGDTYARARDQ